MIDFVYRDIKFPCCVYAVHLWCESSCFICRWADVVVVVWTLRGGAARVVFAFPPRFPRHHRDAPANALLMSLLLLRPYDLVRDSQLFPRISNIFITLSRKSPITCSAPDTLPLCLHPPADCKGKITPMSFSNKNRNSIGRFFLLLYLFINRCYRLLHLHSFITTILFFISKIRHRNE